MLCAAEALRCCTYTGSLAGAGDGGGCMAADALVLFGMLLVLELDVGGFVAIVVAVGLLSVEDDGLESIGFSSA